MCFQLKEKLKQYGIENIEDLTLVEDSNNDGLNRGFAFLEFSSRSDAMDAFKRLQKRDVVFGVDRPAKVSFADSFIDPGDEIMAQVTDSDQHFYTNWKDLVLGWFPLILVSFSVLLVIIMRDNDIWRALDIGFDGIIYFVVLNFFFLR